MRKSLLIPVVIGILAILSLACGGSESLEASVSTETPAEVPQANSAPSDDGSIKITTLGEQLRFSEKTLTAAPGEVVTVTFINAATNVKHNWVLVEAGTSSAVAAAGLKAGSENGFVVPDDPNVIAQTAVISGGGTARVTFTTPGVGTYDFVCTIPGHDRAMFGKFVVSN